MVRTMTVGTIIMGTSVVLLWWTTIGGAYYVVGTMVVGTMVVVLWYNIMCKQVGHIGEA